MIFFNPAHKQIHLNLYYQIVMYLFMYLFLATLRGAEDLKLFSKHVFGRCPT